MKDVIRLEADSVRFYSAQDETVFFAWLKGLACVEQVVGRGLTLYIDVNRPVVDEDALRELLAIFRRYGIDMRPLAQLDLEKFAGWFRDPSAYWFEQVFGRP